jgi:hypothetical protein
MLPTPGLLDTLEWPRIPCLTYRKLAATQLPDAASAAHDAASGVYQSKAQGMATPSNKPRDIKDLKARLGRTMTPGQVGGSAPPGPGPGASVPAPKVGGSLPPPAVRNPLSGAPMPGAHASVPAPPFAQPGRGPAQASRPAGPMASHAPAGRPAAAPFDVMATPQQAIVEKKVKLVIDDSAVKSSESQVGQSHPGRDRPRPRPRRRLRRRQHRRGQQAVQHGRPRR